MEPTIKYDITSLCPETMLAATNIDFSIKKLKDNCLCICEMKNKDTFNIHCAAVDVNEVETNPISDQLTHLKINLSCNRPTQTRETAIEFSNRRKQIQC